MTGWTLRALDPDPAFAGFEEVLQLRDPAIGLHGFIAIHSRARGPAFGGVRRARYASPEQARDDACALARAMSIKCALAGLPAGGAKTVLMDPPDADHRAVYEAVGAAVASLDGGYVCGPDVGTSAEHLDHVRSRTQWVNPAGNDAGASTARGVLAATRALVETLRPDGGDEPRYFVEGLGAVGLAVARGLVDGGASVAGWDTSPEARARASRAGVAACAPSVAESPRAAGGVLMPCALGASITPARVGELTVRGICGSANNQIAPGAAEALQSRGLRWVPDVVSSAGAVIEGVMTVTASVARSEVDPAVAAAIDGIGVTARAILDEARRTGARPDLVALERARELLPTLDR